jgi:hypothetical protein
MTCWHVVKVQGQQPVGSGSRAEGDDHRRLAKAGGVIGGRYDLGAASILTLASSGSVQAAVAS